MNFKFIASVLFQEAFLSQKNELLIINKKLL